MKRSQESGSHVLALAFGVVVIAAIAFSGYKVWQMQQPASGSNVSTSTTTAAISVPATIKTSTDLQQTASALDAASTQLNASLNDSALNPDLNSML